MNDAEHAESIRSPNHENWKMKFTFMANFPTSKYVENMNIEYTISVSVLNDIIAWQKYLH